MLLQLLYGAEFGRNDGFAVENSVEKGKSFIKICKKVYNLDALCYTMWAKCKYYVIPDDF